MKEGGKAELYCPSDLAYGDRGAPPKIPPGAVLKFEVELLEILKEGDDEKPADKGKEATKKTEETKSDKPKEDKKTEADPGKKDEKKAEDQKAQSEGNKKKLIKNKFSG